MKEDNKKRLYVFIFFCVCMGLMMFAWNVQDIKNGFSECFCKFKTLWMGMEGECVNVLSNEGMIYEKWEIQKVKG